MSGFDVAKPPRPIHRDGSVFTAKFQPATIVPWLADIAMFNGTCPSRAVVRWSTFMPIREGRAQVLCLAVNLVTDPFTGEGQDLLFFSSRERLRLHVVPSRPSRAAGTVFSTAMPYRVGQQRVIFGARVPMRRDLAASGACESAWAELVDMMTTGFELEIMTALLGGRWWHVGTLTDFRPYGRGGDSHRYRPSHSCPELALSRAGRWRDCVYRHFQPER